MIDSAMLDRVPELVMFTVLALLFLKYQKSRDAVLTEISSQCHAAQDRNTKAFVDAQDRATKAIDANTMVMGEVKAVMMACPGVKENGHDR